ncbi:MAG: peptide chain release factor 3 [Betaproteobacteria bacterium]|nr:peptide chain release factor 3 [Betaproteobacteria bacterium]MBL8533598.1 peptide chain release factor 3 [Betaproteobacteria bacterium]
MTDITPELLAERVAQRRTFAIISHPDAGKTTLTEKLLLFAGAIQIAGSVKARKASRHATSDWMEIEKQRGISVASSVMQMDYRDHVVNLLDTPGHQDFSEDTYRVLTAVDAALMVIDAANGVEAQTLRLLEVCRSRGTPIITFINKMDREVRPPLDLIDEIERTLGMSAVPFSWPIGMGKRFHGVYDLQEDRIRVFKAGEDRVGDDIEVIHGLDNPSLSERFSPEIDQARDDVELVREATPAFSLDEFLAGKQTPVFFGSAINNFGVREVLDAIVDIAPPPQARVAVQGPVQPDNPKFTGVVFKIQANMDPAHRDRVVFVRVCSGRFERGMRLRLQRTGKEFRPSTVVSFLSQRRELLDEAYAGDIIGIPTHGGLQLGDTLSETAEPLQFTGLPFFAPEIFRGIEVVDPLKTKQLRTGLIQLGEEGAIQVFRPMRSTILLLGAVGVLQFDVAAHRLKHEYGVEARILPSNYTCARWVSADDPAELDRFVEANAGRVAQDAADAYAVLTANQYEMRVVQDMWPKIRFHAKREHAGLQLEAAA